MARANPRVESLVSTGMPFSQCEIGSRWNRYTLSESDVGKKITIKNNVVNVGDNSFTTDISDSSFRTDIDPSRVGNDLAAPKTDCSNDVMSWYSNKGWTCLTHFVEWLCTDASTPCQQTCFDHGMGYN